MVYHCQVFYSLYFTFFGGENRIRTYSGISHEVYSLAQLSRFGVSPIIFYIELSNSDFLFSKTETTCRNFWSSVFTLRSSNIFFVIFTALNVCSSILIIFSLLNYKLKIMTAAMYIIPNNIIALKTSSIHIFIITSSDCLCFPYEL
jgi:hypothetical protein